MKRLVKSVCAAYSAFRSTQAKMLFRLFVAQVLLIVCSATSDIRYVRPADSPLSSCPGQPCLTLHEYVEIDNFINGTTLQFLPGNHTLQQSFRLVHISNITFEAVNHSVTNIICKDNVTIHCIRVTHLHIVGLLFILSQRNDRYSLWFSHCDTVLISDAVFQGSGEVTGGAIGVISSDATISRCVFNGLTVTGHGDGGAIHSRGTNLTIHESSFINNAAYSGGAISAIDSSLLLNETIYHGNSAKFMGGAISSTYKSQVDMVGNNTFHNNSCQYYGGAVSFLYSQLSIMNGSAHFHCNEAKKGGAISLHLTNTLLNGSVTMMKNKAAINGGALHIDNIYVFGSKGSNIININEHWHWLNRLKPLLDSYYAPYKNNARYWTGLLLLVRCALYIIFSISGANISLVSITLTFSVIGFIYTSQYLWKFHSLLFTKPGSLLLPPPLFSKPVAPPPLQHTPAQHKTP